MSQFQLGHGNMKLTADEGRAVRSHASLNEAELREDLAAAYRITHMLAMDGIINNHISVRVPGPDKHFLLNPYGLSYDEVTASNLVKIDINGNLIDGGSDVSVNFAGFLIHGAIHDATSDMHCVMHTHSSAGVALASLKTELLPLNQGAMAFYGRVGYHDYEGIVSDPEERGRLLRGMAGKPALILRNHGLLTAAPSIAGAVILMIALEEACRTQLTIHQSGIPFLLPSPQICSHTAAQHWKGVVPPASYGQKAFLALKRRLDRIDDSYKR
jgi:ribulose-5-phosphate 4-epimerase/fuculose-1-phosphate aldolase